MARTHRYSVTVRWTGNTGTGTSNYQSYERAHEISAGAEKPMIAGSSAPEFRGDAGRWNPEELLIASLSACHELWYLHLCADSGVQVISYMDHAEGVMEEADDGSGRLAMVLLRPEVTIARAAHMEKSHHLHEAARRMCFIANSVNFPVRHEPKIIVAESGS